MKRYLIATTGPATVRAYGLVIPPDGIERALDEATLGLVSGDARLTVTPVKGSKGKAETAAPKKTRGRRS